MISQLLEVHDCSVIPSLDELAAYDEFPFTCEETRERYIQSKKPDYIQITTARRLATTPAPDGFG